MQGFRRIGSDIPRALVVLTGFILGLPTPSAGFPNGDFKQNPNLIWHTDGSNTLRVAQGDSPTIVIGARGNRYGHVGDADGRGLNGENPSRMFTWFACVDSVSLGNHCTVSFRFRTLLLQGELAWVRMRTPNQKRVWQIPNSNNQWAAGRRSVTLPGACGQNVFIDFGMFKQGGGQVGGRLNIDDIEHRCSLNAPQPPADQNWNFLPTIPVRDSSVVVRPEQISIVFVQGDLTIAILILVGIGLLFWSFRKS